jgi:hypothetical protein
MICPRTGKSNVGRGLPALFSLVPKLPFGSERKITIKPCIVYIAYKIRVIWILKKE